MKSFFYVLVVSLVLFILFISSSTATYALSVFSDNFDSGNDSQWSRISGANNWYFSDGQYGAISDSIPAISIANIKSLPESYTFEYDMIGLTGIDRTIDMRWSGDAPSYLVHFNGGANYLYKNGVQPEGWPVPSYYGLINGQIYHFKVVLDKGHIVIYANNNKIIDTVDSSYTPVIDEKFGLRVPTGGAGGVDNVRFDNVLVRDIEPGDLPGQDLNVTSLKQISDPWQSQMYDSADVWSPLNSTIGRWGCALTSAAMVFNYQGLTKLSDAEPLNPGTLNTWLKNQPDGYIRSGWINWLALSRLSKQITGINGVTGFDALEYKRENNQNDTVLTSDLTNGNPDILEEPGHFVVAKGTSGAGFDINDPFYNISSLFDGYGNTYLSIGRYIPSFTDLSYIMLVIDDTTQVSLNDGSGTSVGSIYTQNPIKDPISGVANGTALKFVYLPVPQAGNYNITVSGLINQQYTLGAYLYSVDGNVNKIIREGFAGPGTQDRYILSYNNQNVSNTSAEKLVDFNTTRSDVNEAAAIGEVRSGNPLLSSLSNAENNWHNGNLEKAQTDMNLFIKHLDSQRGKGITESAYQILHYDSVYIKTHVL